MDVYVRCHSRSLYNYMNFQRWANNIYTTEGDFYDHVNSEELKRLLGDNINITAKDIYDNSSLNTFNVTVQAYKDFNASEGLVAVWHLDENSTNQKDSTGNGNALKQLGNIDYNKSGRLNSAYRFYDIGSRFTNFSTNDPIVTLIF